MSLMEGFSDWVMDEVGAELIPDVASIRRRFETRRGQRRRGIDRILARLTGMDLKLEQYRRGERFVAGVHALGGRAAIAHLWDGPETLPSGPGAGRPGSLAGAYRASSGRLVGTRLTADAPAGRT